MAVKNGDKICASIAAASIIAKVYRDSVMRKLHLVFPQYGFGKHKGYGTKLHQEAIKKYGLSKIHRTSYNLGFLMTCHPRLVYPEFTLKVHPEERNRGDRGSNSRFPLSRE